MCYKILYGIDTGFIYIDIHIQVMNKLFIHSFVLSSIFGQIHSLYYGIKK